MARFSLCMTSIFLLSLLVLASASDNAGHDPKAEGLEEQKPTEEKGKLPKYTHAPKPDYEKVKPRNYGQPKPEWKKKLIPIPKPDYEQQKKTEEKEKVLHTKPVYEKPKPEGEEKLVLNYTKPYYKKPVSQNITDVLPRTIGVQGIVLCKSGPKNFPIPGAVVRITCLAVEENGHKTSYFSVRTKACDSKGYFYSTLSPPSSLGNYGWKIKECKAYLDHSPLEKCKFSTDVNNGTTGHLLSSYTILKHSNIKLYSVGAFFYASEPNYKKPIPNGY